MKALLTVAEVAALLKVSKITVWRQAKNGVFPAPVTIGGSKRWRPEDIEEYVRDAE